MGGWGEVHVDAGTGAGSLGGTSELQGDVTG